jgi:SAM-dependent methyltransferase
MLADDVRDYEYGAPGVYAWLRCSGCNLVRLSPSPSDDVLALAYPPTYHAYGEPQSRLVAWYIERRRHTRAAILADLLPPNGTILDVGCGTGALLAAVGRQGAFRLLGVEYRPDAAEQARREGITVWTGELENADIPEGQVDVVVMEHVIEHVRDPIATLQRIRSLLKSGGRIVGETPNLHCPDAKLFGRYWGGGHAPRHMWLFTPPVLERALKATGFADIAIRHPIYPAHMALSLQNRLRCNRRDLRGLTRGRAWYFPLVCSALMPVAALATLCRCSGAVQFRATAS